MGFRDYEVEWYGSSGEDDAVILQNVVSASVTFQMKSESNKASIVLDYVNQDIVEDGELIVKADDIIKIYAAEGIIDKSNPDHFIGSFVVQDFEYEPDNKTVTANCADKTYVMLSQIVTLPSSLKPTNEHIENIIQTANENGATVTPESTQIATLKSDGTVFKDVEYTTTYKAAYEAIADLSQPEYTGDTRPYIFYFDENEVFHWEYPGQTPLNQTFSYGELPVVDMSFDRTESDQISMIIYNAGNDKNDVARVFYYVDPNQSSLDSSRIRYFPMTDISRDYRKYLQDIGQYNSISNDDYIAKLDEIAKSRCQAIIESVGRGLFQADITVDGAKYPIGGLYTTRADKYGLYKTNLRLNRVKHDMDKGGWSTRLTLKEDPDEIDLS